MRSTFAIPLYDAPGIFQSWYDPEVNAFVSSVYNLNHGIHRRLGFEIHIAAMEKYKFDTMVFDAGNAVGHHQPDDLDWIVNVAMPAYRRSNIKTIVYIFPKSFIAKVGAKTWLELAAAFDFNFMECKSLQDAYMLLRDKKKD